MERKLQQRVVGTLVLAAIVLLIAPVLFDAEGRIPAQITQIPAQPNKPDLSSFSSTMPALDLTIPAGAEANAGLVES
ncbi:MAG: cell division septation protein DedD, partial [Reinekea sp.]